MNGLPGKEALTTGTIGALRHIDQLDSLRAIAVILVLAAHWTDATSWTHLPLGPMGVDVFFVLSGFLITQILLVNRPEGHGTSERLGAIKNFVMRRTLRIFPLYYIVITAWFLVRWHSNIDTGDAIWFYTYLSNFHIVFDHAGGVLTPTWSLAVEEQFYLLWPWLIIFLPARTLMPAIVTCIFVGAISLPILTWIFPGNATVSCLTPPCFSSFGLGGLLAWVVQSRPDLLPEFQKYLRWASVVSLLAIALYAVVDLNVDLRIPVSLVTAFVILYNLRPHESWSYRHVYSNKGLIEIGKISYCIYLVHNLVPPMLASLAAKLSSANVYIPFLNVFPEPSLEWPAALFLNIVITYVIARLSWRFIERPFNNAKKYFVSPKTAVAGGYPT